MAKPTLTTEQTVKIYRTMIECRREFSADTDFFRMTDILDKLSEDKARFRLKTYVSNKTGRDNIKKASALALDDLVTIVVDEALLTEARKGCKFSNFVLAHELSHVELGHYDQTLSIRHFQLVKDRGRLANRPPNEEELEANAGAVFFQCGVALMDASRSSIELAKRAYSDPYLVKRYQQYVRLEIFRRELERQTAKGRRVVL
jgi:hypothetical protein